MAYSIQREVSDGTLVLLDVSISYIERSEITVYFDNVLQTEGATWAWVGTTDAKLSFTPAVPIGVEVTVRRSTDTADLRHRYSAGAAFTAGSIDESFEQVLHIAQEATESALGGDFFQDLNMHTYKIKNLGAAVDPMDAVPLAQYQADALGASVARNEAVAAKNTAVAAKDTAVAAKDTAVASSTSAQTSASTATAQAGIATTKASEAAASAASALTSKNSATASATDATTSKNAAAASATAAANSAAAALNPWQVISPTEIRYAGIVGVDTLRIAGADVTAALASKAPLNGVGATGTWPVSITGNAATATNADNASQLGSVAAAAYVRLVNGGGPDVSGNVNVNTMPTGAIIYHAASSAPTGFLKANGAAISRTTYAALFSVIGTVFGAGDGSTTFNLPDLRGEFIRGFDDGRSVDSGRDFGSWQEDAFRSHRHVIDIVRSNTSSGPYAEDASAGTPQASSYTGYEGGTETRPRNVALLACIKY